MAWIKLSDDYNDHPKFRALSDGAFRLWHQAMGFCRKFQTDGMIPRGTVREFPAYSPKRMRELQTPWRAGENPLWHDVDGFGIKVHDFLVWNPSKDEEQERRAGSKDRMRSLREERRVTPGVAPPVSANSVLTTRTCSHDVLDRRGTSTTDLEKDERNLAERAGRLREDTYPRLYSQYRHGARLRLTANSLEFQDALSLVAQWDDERLEKLAALVLTTDDPWISGTDRGFKIFALKASWADDRLSKWEQEQAAS